jgi:hypothetical protein
MFAVINDSNKNGNVSLYEILIVHAAMSVPIVLSVQTGYVRLILSMRLFSWKCPMSASGIFA